MTRWNALPPAARVLAEAGLFAAAILGSLVYSTVISPADRAWAFLALTIASVLACFGRFFVTDPIACISIVAPPLALAGAAVVVPRHMVPLTLLSGAWLITWVIASAALWPWWRRVILRRERPGSAVGEVKAAYRRLYALSRTEAGWWDWAIWMNEREGLARWFTPKTAPVIATITSIQHLWATDNLAGEALGRVMRRMGQELRRMSGPPRLSIPGLRPAGDLGLRTTARTSLEYEYPHLEALLAEANAPERHRMGIEAARIALRTSEILTPAREVILARSEDGPASPEVIAAVEADQEAARAAWMAFEAERSGDMDPAEVLAIRQARALSALSCAISPLVWPLDETDALYEAACSLPDSRDVSELEAMAEEVISPERSAQAQIVPDHDIQSSAPGAAADQNSRHADEWPLFATLPRGLLGVCQLALIALAVASLGTIVRTFVEPVYAESRDSVLINRAVHATVAWLGLYLVLRVWSGRPSLADAVVLIFPASWATPLAEPIRSAAETLFRPAVPSLWFRLFEPSTAALPDALFNGIALAITLVGASFGLKAIRAIGQRRARTPQRGPAEP